MQVDIDVELLRQIKYLFEMRVRIGVHVGTAADRFATVAQGRDQEFFRAGIVGQAFLRKHADREIERPGIVALQRLDRLEAAQAYARIDFHMGAHAGGAMHDGALDHFCAARVDVLDREFALHRRDRGNGLSHAAVVMPAAAEQAGFIQMDVGIDEAGQGQFAADLDLGRLASEPWRDGGDPPAAHADIDRGGRGPRPDVAEDEVEGRFRVHGSELAGAGPEPSRRAAAGQLQIVCSSEARLFKIYACSLAGRL